MKAIAAPTNAEARDVKGAIEAYLGVWDNVASPLRGAKVENLTFLYARPWAESNRLWMAELVEPKMSVLFEINLDGRATLAGHQLFLAAELK